jgi:hypothetical protein
MGEIDIIDAATAGLRLMARRPLSVLIWGLSMTVLVALLFALFGGGLAASIGSLVAAGGAQPTPQQILGLVFSAFGLIFLLAVGGELLALVLRAAAIRAELEPEHGAFAYMRFGDQELWLLATSFVFWLVLFGANFVMSIPLTLFTMASAIGAAASAQQGGAPNFGAFAGMAGLRVFGQLIIAGVSIWLWLRLSLGVVMTFRERQFRLFESWAVTRGHVLRMFLAMLLVWVMLMALYLVLVIMAVVAFGATIVAIGQDPRAFFSRPAAEWVNALTPLIIVCLIGLVVGVSAGNALIWGAVARMWRQLHPEADAAKAFA